MSAVSNILIPASRQISTRRRASAASLAPQAWKNSPFPPNVPAPKLRTGTLKPDAPSLRNSTLSLLNSTVVITLTPEHVLSAAGTLWQAPGDQTAETEGHRRDRVGNVSLQRCETRAGGSRRVWQVF